MTEKKSSRLWLFRLIAIFLGLIFIFIFGEIALRFFPKLVADPPAPPPYNYRIPDGELGWFVQENYHHEGEMRDKSGAAYPISINFGTDGFRTFGNPAATDRRKIMIIGDSYTAAAQTSDEKTWHRLLADSLGAEIFAYGAAGFGSTQEVLILKKFIEKIRPDLVIWQFCSNDFIDNYWELEKKANYHVRMRRPYTLPDGSIERHLAAEFPRNLKSYSHFLYFIVRRVMLARGTFDKPPAEPSEKFIAEQNENYPPFAECLKMTDACFKNFKKTLPPGTKSLAFCADGFEPQYGHFEKLCQKNEIQFAAGLPQFVQSFEGKECVRTDDGYHWNNRGNELVASFLKNKIHEILK